MFNEKKPLKSYGYVIVMLLTMASLFQSVVVLNSDPPPDGAGISNPNASDYGGSKQVSIPYVQKQISHYHGNITSDNLTFTLDHTNWNAEKFEINVKNVSDYDMRTDVIQNRSGTEDKFIIPSHTDPSYDPILRPQEFGSNFTFDETSILDSTQFRMRFFGRGNLNESKWFMGNITVDIRTDAGGVPSDTNLVSVPINSCIIVEQNNIYGETNQTYINKTVGYVLENYWELDEGSLYNTIIKTPPLNLTLAPSQYWVIINGSVNHTLPWYMDIWLGIFCYDDGVDASVFANRSFDATTFEIDNPDYFGGTPSEYDMMLTIYRKIIDYSPPHINMKINGDAVGENKSLTLRPNTFSYTDFVVSADRNVHFIFDANATLNHTGNLVQTYYSVVGDNVVWSGSIPIGANVSECLYKAINITFPDNWLMDTLRISEHVSYSIVGHTAVFGDVREIGSIHFTINSTNVITGIDPLPEKVNASSVLYFNVYCTEYTHSVRVELWNNGTYIYTPLYNTDGGTLHFKLLDSLINGTGYYLRVVYDKGPKIGSRISTTFEIVEVKLPPPPDNSTSGDENNQTTTEPTTGESTPSDTTATETSSTTQSESNAPSGSGATSLYAAIGVGAVISVVGYIALKRRS